VDLKVKNELFPTALDKEHILRNRLELPEVPKAMSKITTVLFNLKLFLLPAFELIRAAPGTYISARGIKPDTTI